MWLEGHTADLSYNCWQERENLFWLFKAEPPSTLRSPAITWYMISEVVLGRCSSNRVTNEPEYCWFAGQNGEILGSGRVEYKTHEDFDRVWEGLIEDPHTFMAEVIL